MIIGSQLKKSTRRALLQEQIKDLRISTQINFIRSQPPRSLASQIALASTQEIIWMAIQTIVCLLLSHQWAQRRWQLFSSLEEMLGSSNRPSRQLEQALSLLCPCLAGIQIKKD